MASFTKLRLSESASGEPIVVASNATPGTTIHTAQSALDEVYLWVSNVTGGAVTLTVLMDGVKLCSALSVAANSAPIALIDGALITNSKLITAYASAINSLHITGYVNRIT